MCQVGRPCVESCSQLVQESVLWAASDECPLSSPQSPASVSGANWTLTHNCLHAPRGHSPPVQLKHATPINSVFINITPSQWNWTVKCCTTSFWIQRCFCMSNKSYFFPPVVFLKEKEWLIMPAELTLDDVSCQECCLCWCAVQPPMQQISLQLQVNLVACDLLLEAERIRRVELHSEAQQDWFHVYEHVTKQTVSDPVQTWDRSCINVTTVKAAISSTGSSIEVC